MFVYSDLYCKLHYNYFLPNSKDKTMQYTVKNGPIANKGYRFQTFYYFYLILKQISTIFNL